MRSDATADIMSLPTATRLAAADHTPVVVLIACAVLAAVGRGVAESYAVFLLPLSEAFDWDRASAASVYAVLLLSLGLSAPVMGRIFDAWGPGLLYAVGLTLLGGGMLLASLMEAQWQFYLAVGLLGGCGASAISVFSHAALLTRWFRNRLTTAIAAVSAAAGLGVLVVSPVTQLLIGALGWRNAYLVLGVAVLLLLLPLVALPWKVIGAGPKNASHPDLLSGRAGSEGRTLREALRMRAFWALCSIHFLTAAGMFAINPQIVACLVEVGFSRMTAAGAFGIAGAAATAGLLIFGWLADRFGRLLSITLSYSMTLAGFVLLAAIQARPSGWLLALFIVIYGPSFGSRGPIISATTARIFGRGRNFGSILGAVSLGMGTGAAFGATIGGLLHDWTGGYDAVSTFAFVTVAAGMAVFWGVPEVRRPPAAA